MSTWLIRWRLARGSKKLREATRRSGVVHVEALDEARARTAGILKAARSCFNDTAFSWHIVVVAITLMTADTPKPPRYWHKDQFGRRRQTRH